MSSHYTVEAPFLRYDVVNTPITGQTGYYSAGQTGHNAGQPTTTATNQYGFEYDQGTWQTPSSVNNNSVTGMYAQQDEAYFTGISNSNQAYYNGYSATTRAQCGTQACGTTPSSAKNDSSQSTKNVSNENSIIGNQNQCFGMNGYNNQSQNMNADDYYAQTYPGYYGYDEQYLKGYGDDSNYTGANYSSVDVGSKDIDSMWGEKSVSMTMTIKQNNVSERKGCRFGLGRDSEISQTKNGTLCNTQQNVTDSKINKDGRSQYTGTAPVSHSYRNDSKPYNRQIVEDKFNRTTYSSKVFRYSQSDISHRSSVSSSRPYLKSSLSSRGLRPSGYTRQFNSRFRSSTGSNFIRERGGCFSKPDEKVCSGHPDPDGVGSDDSSSVCNSAVYLDATNYNRWGFLRKRYGRLDNNVADHLFEIHEKFCQDCKKTNRFNKPPTKRKSTDGGEDMSDKELTEEEQAIKQALGFAGFKSTKGAKEKDNAVISGQVIEPRLNKKFELNEKKKEEEEGVKSPSSTLTSKEKQAIEALGGYNVFSKPSVRPQFGAPAVSFR